MAIISISGNLNRGFLPPGAHSFFPEPVASGYGQHDCFDGHVSTHVVKDSHPSIKSQSQNIFALAEASTNAFQTIKLELEKIADVVLRALVAQGITYLLLKSGLPQIAAMVEAAYVINEVKSLYSSVENLFK